MLDVVDKAACPPLVEMADAEAVCYLFAQQAMPQNAAPMYSNIIKKYANWNVCFSCGFDVEDGHTLKTCPAPWRRANHQEGFDGNNSGQYIAAGYDVCTKAMHKSQWPNM